MNNYGIKRGLTVVCLIILTLLSAACGKEAIRPVSRIDLAKDGTIRAVMTSAFDKDYYSLSELEDGITMAVEEYNKKSGGFEIELKKIRQEGQFAEVVMNYRSAATYASFNNVTLFNGTVEEGLANDSLPGETVLLPAAEGYEKTTARELAKVKKPGHFLVFTEPLSVSVPGRILYLSEGLSVDDEGRVAVSAELANGSLLTKLVYVIYE